MQITNEFFQNKKVLVYPLPFAIYKSLNRHPRAFAIIEDHQEITVIVPHTQIIESDVIEISKNWRLISFDFILDFDLIGFMASISRQFAEAGISIMPLAAFSTDHIFVQQKEITKAIKILKALGMNCQDISV